MKIQSLASFLVAALMFVVVAHADAQTSLIDVNNNQGVPASPDASSNFWSVLTTTGGPGVALVDKTTNAPTGGLITVTQSAGSGSGFTGSLVENGPAPGDFNTNQAFRDGWFDNTAGGGNGTFSYSNLNSNSRYVLTLWGNRDANWADGNVAIQAGTVGGGPNFALLQNQLLELPATTDGAGTLSFTFDDTTGGGGANSVLNVMSLEEVGPITAPAARSISVNFGINLNDANAVNIDETAVVGNPHAKNESGLNWNNVLLQSTAAGGAPTTFTANTQGGDAIVLTDNGGLEAASVTTSGSMFSNFANTSSPSPSDTGDAGLFQSYLNVGGSVTGESITISDLGAAFTDNGYDVVLFFDLNQDRTYGFTVDDGTTSETFWVDDVASPDADANNDGTIEWVQAIGTAASDATVGANYALFSDLENSSFTITGLGSNGRATLSGFQVIANAAAVPEPSSIALWSMLAVLGVGFGIWQRRKQR